jgi:hypothetical protein
MSLHPVRLDRADGLSTQSLRLRPSSLLGLDQFREMTANALDAIVLLGDSITQGGWEAGGFSQQLACKQAGLNKSLSFALLTRLVSLDKYARRLDVINRGRLYFSRNCKSHLIRKAGLSGYNTDWGIHVFEQTLAKAAVAHLYPKMQLLIIWFGERFYLSQSRRLILPLIQYHRSKRFCSRTLAAIRSYRQIQGEFGTFDCHGPRLDFRVLFPAY